MPYIVDPKSQILVLELIRWDSFLAWCDASPLKTCRGQGISVHPYWTSVKQNEIGKPELLWKLTHVRKLRVICNWGPRHTKSNVVDQDQEILWDSSSHQLFTLNLLWYSIMPRSYNRDKERRNSLFPLGPMVVLEHMRKETNYNMISNSLVMRGHWLYL